MANVASASAIPVTTKRRVVPAGAEVVAVRPHRDPLEARVLPVVVHGQRVHDGLAHGALHGAEPRLEELAGIGGGVDVTDLDRHRDSPNEPSLASLGLQKQGGSDAGRTGAR